MELLIILSCVLAITPSDKLLKRLFLFVTSAVAGVYANSIASLGFTKIIANNISSLVVCGWMASGFVIMWQSTI